MPVAGQLYYSLHQAKGADLPVVLLHGAGGMHLFWPPEVRRLPGCRLYALDLPGHGKSDTTGCSQTISGYAERVQQWMDAAGLARAVFIGHSMGGAIAISLALYYPDQVLGLGLLGVGARMRVNPDLLANAASTTTFYNAIEMIVSWSYGKSASPRLVELASRYMSKVRPSVLYSDLLACDGFDVTDSLQRLSCPTLVLCGVEDRMTPLRNAQFISRAIPGAQLVQIPGAGHMVMLEQPQAVASTLSAFLATISY